MITGSRNTVKLARKLRSEMTLPESKLWIELRKRPGGYKFRRQQPAGRFVRDFYCAAVKLAVEVDGQAHDGAVAVDRDKRRSAWLRDRGIAITRIPARLILQDIEAVVTQLVEICDTRRVELEQTPCSPLHHPADHPSSPVRGGWMIAETAYAKINLALHVRGKREDGHHEIETLFAFVDAGDVLVARAAEADRLETAGEFADVLDNPFDNLVARTMTALPREGGLHVTLEKNLPVAAGLGGGSADAGAMFRIIQQTHGLPDDWEEKAIRLGADVPACVASEMAIGRGTGTDLEPVENDMAGMVVLLVNPRVPLPTGPVFKAWAGSGEGEDLGPLPEGTAREIARNGRNDLRPPAVAICPPITDVLEALGATDPWMCEMSGSGATCFALYDETEMRDKAARAIAEQNPGWWQMTGTLR